MFHTNFKLIVIALDEIASGHHEIIHSVTLYTFAQFLMAPHSELWVVYDKLLVKNHERA